jgi:diaminohydroxyphosphoribosylaminopyrimidine deaminase / 5-amino-6-(5-phosphoribosylamino)uracil reductase
MTSTQASVSSESIDATTASEHCRWIDEALELAAKARGWTSPNPMVGSVVVRDGNLVGAGYHERAGGPHAEVHALNAAGEAARDADIYVTLEPCSHHGRTPPCTDRIIKAGVKRVICSHLDPDPRVNGRGTAILRDAGIEVIVGVGEDAARRLNEHYLHWKRTGRPWVTAKWAQTLDGQVATRSGSSKWITGETARREAHRQRSFHDAVLVGIGTALADDPQLSVRHVEGHQPWHVVLDSNLRLPANARLVEPERTLIMCSPTADTSIQTEWRDRGIDIAVIQQNDTGRLDPLSVLETLGERGMLSVMVEGGPTVVSGLLGAGLVNRVMTFVAPKLIGIGTPAVGDLGTQDIAEAIRLTDMEYSQFGDDLLLTGLIGDTDN